MPTQNPRKPFPAWRLPKGIISASEEQLDESIESCERAEWFGGGLVVAGVIATVAIAAFHPSYDSWLERWGSAMADSLVALGVGIEIKFGQMAGLRQNELRRRSDEKVAEAKERAAEANQKAKDAELELTKLLERLSPRRLTQQGQELISARISGFAGITGVIASSPSEIESMRLEMGIHAALSMGGWKITRGQPITTPMWPGGVVINTPRDTVSISAAVRLAEALNDLGIYAVPMPTLHTPPQHIFITIGTKPDSTELDNAKIIVREIKTMTGESPADRPRESSI
jgi:hypothetical protein